MKVQLDLTKGEVAIANVNTLATPDQGAPRGAQQTQPSDEDLEIAKQNREQEEKDKAKDTADKKKEGKDESDDASDAGDDAGDDADSDSADSDDAGDDDAGADGDADGESDDSPDESEDDGEEGEEESEEEVEEGEEEVEEGEEESEEEGDDSEEEEGGEGEDEDGDEGEEEEALASVGAKRIYRGTAGTNHMYNLISAFPGVGKSHLFREPGSLRVSDSDSSAFDKSQFPLNYVDHIQKVQYDNDLVLISSHSEVRAELKERNMRYVVIYPARCCKEEYLARYLKRGSPASFVELMDKMWDSFIDSCEADSAPSIVLKPGEYLNDILHRLEEE